VDGQDKLFPIFKLHKQKIKHVDFLLVLPDFLERAIANQRAAFCVGFVLIIIFGIIIRLLAVKMAEDETVIVSYKIYSSFLIFFSTIPCFYMK
jgi:hypothetical protein